MAQRKRVGLITQRSEDRNLLLLHILFVRSHATKPQHVDEALELQMMYIIFTHFVHSHSTEPHHVNEALEQAVCLVCWGLRATRTAYTITGST
jgi:hypothetical protein